MPGAALGGGWSDVLHSLTIVTSDLAKIMALDEKHEAAIVDPLDPSSTGPVYLQLLVISL